MLDYRIRSFLAVVEQGTLRKASEAVGLTQPAVSQHLKSLEQEYGQPLFEHSGRRLKLNDAGRLLQAAAEQSKRLEQRLLLDFGGLTDGRASYRIGATLTIGEFILPAYIGEFRQRNHNIDLSIRIENTVSILRLLDRGEIDLAVVEGPFDHQRYYSELFLNDEMIFIGTSDNLPPGCRDIGQQELEHCRLILREAGSGTRFYWEEYLNRRKIKIPQSSVIMEVGSLSAIKSLVEAGYGSSVMSEHAVKKELLLGTIRSWPLRSGPLRRKMYFVYTQRSPSGFVSDFIDFAASLKNETSGMG